MRRLAVLYAIATVAASPSYAPEPDGYWLGPTRGPVPATLKGGTAIDTQGLVQLLQSGPVVLVDVASAPARPDNLAAGAVWLPLPHRDIPGSLWIPRAGDGAISAGMDDFFRRRLDIKTRHMRNTAIAVYCHTSCWLSWNAAKRAISYGYTHVYWYRDGVEGWGASGAATVDAQPCWPTGPADGREPVRNPVCGA